MRVISVAILLFLIKGSTEVVLPADNPSIIIIGSGPSGIAAATRLLNKNLTSVTILEAENRIGGRINSLKFGDAYVDLGAEFCHGQEGNIVYSMVKDFNVLEHSENIVHFYLSNGEKIDEKTGMKIMDFAENFLTSNETIKGCENVRSVGECLDMMTLIFTTTGEDLKEKISFSGAPSWVSSFISSFDSPLDLHDLAPTTNYKECGGDSHMNWNGLGYKTILEVMMQKYPNNDNQLPIDDKILLGKVVSDITNWKHEDKVIVTTTDGNTYQADHVIFTPSVGVLKANYEKLFDPPLPEEKVYAINKIGYGAILKIILHFPVRFWNKNATWSVIWTIEDKEKLKEMNLEWLTSLTGFVPGENNPNVLTTWYAGKYVPVIETLPEEQLIKAYEYLINTFLSPHFNVTMPDKLIRTTWYTNPNFRGTYSYESVEGYTKGKSILQEKLATPLTNIDSKPTVLFAGEATHPYYFSTVHGAIESGYREADRLIKLYKKEAASD